MNKFWKFFKLFILVLFIFIIQSSLIDSFSGFWGRLNLPLLIVVLLFIFQDFKSSLYFALIIGVVLDIYSFYPFGLYSLTFLILLFLADFVWNNFFTNRSIYSFLTLSFFSVVFYNLLLYFLLFLFEKNYFGVFWFNKIFWLNLGLELVWIWLGIILSFYFLSPQKRRSSGLSFDKN